MGSVPSAESDNVITSTPNTEKETERGEKEKLLFSLYRTMTDIVRECGWREHMKREKHWP